MRLPCHGAYPKLHIGLRHEKPSFRYYETSDVASFYGKPTNINTAFSFLRNVLQKPPLFCFGIAESALNFMSSILINHMQLVHNHPLIPIILGCVAPTWVPQVTVLGPFLYSVYTVPFSYTHTHTPTFLPLSHLAVPFLYLTSAL